MSVLVLGGRREGRVDPLASDYGVSDKCLVPLDGRPLITHVLETLRAAPDVARIIVSVNEPEILDPLPIVQRLRDERRFLVVPSRHSLFSSIIDGAAQADFPLIITTADNVFLSPASIAEIARKADAARAGAAVAFARREDVLAAHPEAQRRFYTFADDGYSNCNTYWIANQSAMNAANVFKEGGQFAKNPMRILSAFGLFNLILFRLGIGTLDGAFDRFSRKLGTKIVPIILPDGKSAIDVDNERTHGIAAAIIRQSQKLAA